MRDAKIPRGETDSDVTSPRASQNADVSSLKFRGRIFRPDKGYRPRSLLELHIRTCIGAILNKREWWLKWSRDDGAIRIKWFTELEHENITQTFEWSTREWSPSTLIECIPILYNGFPEDGSDEEKRAFVDKACAKIPYNLIWHSDWREEMDEGGWDANAELFDQETLDEFREANDKMESYGQIAWYFELVRFRKKMKELPLDAWEVPDDCPIGTEEAVAEATEFIIAVHDGEVTKESFEEYLPEGDHRPEILDALWVHVDRIIEELSEIRDCITKTLEKVMDDHGLTNGNAVTEFISPGPVDETWMSDLLITDELKKKFSEQVAVLGNVPDDQKDWHPDSNNQVLDLVHPSLFCCVFGKTKGMAAAPTEGADVVERMQRMVFGASQLVENEHRGSAKYQWIPSDFAITRNGDVEILSYINNLHPLKHRGLYDSIREIFKAFVPLFDRVLSCLLEPEGPLPTMGSGDLFNRDTHEIPSHPSIPELFDIGSAPSSFTLRGKKVQVIVKIAEIHLTPENPTYPGGAWHVEGSDAEQIVSTGIYYFGCDNITVSKLAFRVIVNEPNYQQDDSLGMQAVYGLQSGERLVQALGTVTAMDNRCVVFPNTLQHQVEPFELEDKTRPGIRKILAFFIVDPSKHIPSTSVIPPQQATWLGDGQDAVLHDLSKLKTLPDGVVNKSVKELLDDGMTLEQAKAHRVGLMAERKPADDDRAPHELFFSLCEH